ncbi:MAG: iron-containing alcohol dehydrogenase [Spirochaetaceae bacterium]|nr:iron-containing alcohol dehydrogenase [Spirochaetaceae bacterium]
MSKMSIEECLAHADETKALCLEAGALKRVPSLIRQYFTNDAEGAGELAVYLVADENTWEAAGKALEEVLSAANTGEVASQAAITIAGKYVFPAKPTLHAEYPHVESLRDTLKAAYQGCMALPASQAAGRRAFVPIAIGGGTLNDLVKKAVSELDPPLPYICLATAASVDGFTANGAPLLLDGFKQTLRCAAPRLVIADLDVLAAEPAYLASSGFADLASKIIAGADWLMAEEVENCLNQAGIPRDTLTKDFAEPIDQVAWDMTQTSLMDNLHASIDAVRGDTAALKTLFEALAITGFAMQRLKSSRPVSSAEHMLAHVWEMENIVHSKESSELLSKDLAVSCTIGETVTHGHKVAIGTLAATAFTELFFKNPNAPPSPPSGWVYASSAAHSSAGREAQVAKAFAGMPAEASIIKTALSKLLDNRTAAVINQYVQDKWQGLRSKVLERLVPYAELKSMFEKAGAPTKPEHINISREKVLADIRRAQMIRTRYSIFDLAFDTGCLDTIIKGIGENNEYL